MEVDGTADVAQELRGIERLEDQKERLEAYRAALERVLARGEVEGCEAFVDHVLSEAVPLVLSRQLLSLFASSAAARLSSDVFKRAAQQVLLRVQPRAVSYEEQATLIREQLAQKYEDEEDWSQAARVLAGIDLDSGMRAVDDGRKLRQNIRIAMLFLEDDDAVGAETALKKAGLLINSCKDTALELQFQSCLARILDSKRRFLDAAQRYYDLSLIGGRADVQGAVSEEDQEEALTAAVTCSILAAAGPQRSRILANLYKDGRTAHLRIFPVLQKVYFERILQPQEMEEFARGLKEHQKARTPDGSTVLEKAVIEHNLQAVSRLYANIYFSELGAVLGSDPERAETTAANMFAEGRLKGSINQVEGLLSFEGGEAHAEIAAWDARILALCSRLNGVLDLAAAKGLTRVERPPAAAAAATAVAA